MTPPVRSQNSLKDSPEVVGEKIQQRLLSERTRTLEDAIIIIQMLLFAQCVLKVSNLPLALLPGFPKDNILC